MSSISGGGEQFPICPDDNDENSDRHGQTTLIGHGQRIPPFQELTQGNFVASSDDLFHPTSGITYSFIFLSLT